MALTRDFRELVIPRIQQSRTSPQAKNLFLVVACLQRAEGIRLRVTPAKAA
jgi:hypothetical protein